MMNGNDNDKKKSDNDGSTPKKERDARVDDGGESIGETRGRGGGGGGGGASAVESQLRATEKHVVSGKKQVVSLRQQRPSSLGPTTPSPASAAAAAAAAGAAAPSSTSTSSNNNSNNNSKIEANLRQTEQEILSSGRTSKKKLVSSSISSRSKPETTPNKPATLTVTDALQANLRQTEQQVMSGRKVAKPQLNTTSTPTAATAAATVEANLRQTEQQVLSSKKQAPQTHAGAHNTEQQLRQVQASVMKKDNAEKQGTNILEQVATEMRPSRNAPEEPPASTTQPLQKLDRSLLSANRTRQQQQKGDQRTTIPSAVGPDGHTLSNRELQEMVGDQYQTENITTVRPSPSASTSPSTHVAMGATMPTFDPTNVTPATTSMAAAMQQEQFASDEEAYQRTIQASMADATRPTTASTTAPPPPEPETTPAASAEIQAFVAENAPVTAVAIEEEEAQERAKFRKMIYVIGASLVIIVIVVVVAVVVSSGEGGDGDGKPTFPPTASPTMAPTMAGEAALVDCLASSPVADVLDINQLRTNKTSPQWRAVSWMVNEDEMYQGCTNAGTPSDTKLWERYALATFYFAVNGPKWGICGQNDPFCSSGNDGEKGWLSNSDVCDWFKIWCSDQGSVSRIDFFSNTIWSDRDKAVLDGTLPRDIAVLSDMEMFVVSQYQLYGPIEGLFTLWNKVFTIRMEGNRLTGLLPTNLDQETPLLQSLRLSENRLKGEIPASLGDLPRMRDLRLDDNQLTGSIPPSFGALVNLTRLELQSNQLAGIVPPSLLNLSSLQELYLEDNPNLQGEIPSRIGNMVDLRRLRLGSTQIGGTLPPEFFWLTSLVDFLVPQADFRGELDPAQWRNLSVLEEWDIGFNNFEGQVPNIFHEMSSLQIIRLQGNDLVGTFDEAICSRRGREGRGIIQALVIDSNIDCPAANCCEICDTPEECESKGFLREED